MHSRLSGGIVAMLALVALVVPTSVPAAGVAADSPPVRITLLGDSITHGTAGDYTWRYFAWKQLQRSGVNADFVGPENDLWQNNHDYVDSNFDQDHAARFGDAFAWLAHPVTPLMTAQHPDVLVILLGLNDLTFAQLTPQQVLDQTKNAVDAARAVNPSVKLVLSRLTATWIEGVNQFNALLSQAAPTWSTVQSPIAVANSDSGFGESTAALVKDTTDQVHPNAVGQQKIAAAMVDALAQLGVGSAYPRPLAPVPLGPRIAAHLTAVPGDAALELTWSNPPGATSERVWLRDVTLGGAETQVAEVAGSAAHLGGLVNGHVYDVSLQAAKGFVPAEDLRSNVVRIRPLGAVPGQPTSVVARAGDHAAAISWAATPGADSYLVWRRNVSAGAGWVAQATSVPTATLTGLEAGARYDFRVQALSTGGAGPFSATVAAVPQGPVVAAVRWVSVRASRSGMISLRWRPSPRATQYVVYQRDVTHHRAWQRIATGRPPSVTSLRLSGHRRGVRYAFYVRSMHQRVVGGRSTVARVRVPR